MNIRKDFQSWDSFLSYLKNTKPLWNIMHCESESRSASDWFGSKSWDDAMDYAVKGHPVARAAIANAAVKVTSSPEPQWDVAPVGAFPCIPAYAAGVPEDMFVQSEDAPPVSSPIIRIVVNMTAAASVEAHQIVNRGAAIVTLIDRIQSTGKRVELIAAEQSKTRDSTFSYFVTVKRPEEPVDIDRIGLVFATPIFLRRFMFRLMECTSPEVIHNYGSPAHRHEEFEGSDLVIPPITPEDCRTASEANALIQSLWDRAAQAA